MEDVELTGLGPMIVPPFALVPLPSPTPVDVFDMSTLRAALPVYLPVSMDIDVADETAGVDDDELMEDAPAVVVEQQLGSRPHQQAAQTAAQVLIHTLLPHPLPMTPAYGSQGQTTLLPGAPNPETFSFTIVGTVSGPPQGVKRKSR
jgi:hypothetical protein